MMTGWDFGLRLVLFLATNVLVAYAAVAVARHWARGFLTRTEILATAIILATTLIVVTQILLGLLGMLIWWLVMALNGFLAVGLLLMTRQRPVYPASRDTDEEHSRDPIAWGVLLTVGVITLVNLRKEIGMPPFGADSLGYHLPMAIEWLQTGTILIQNPTPFSFYPGVSELVDLWLLLPFHDSLLVNLQNWPFALLTVLTLYNLARRTGIPVRWAVYGSLLFVGIRSVQLTLAFGDFQDNDILIAAFFLVAVNLSIAAVESENRALLAGAGIALGLLIGTKYSGLGYALLAIAAHIFLSATRSRARRLIGDISILVAVTALVGGFWYMRNWINLRNPLPPVALVLAGHVLFPGRATLLGLVPQESTILARISDAGALQWFVNYALLEKGGMATVLTIPVLLLTTFKQGYTAITRRRYPPLEVVLYALLPWGTLFLLLVTPLAIENIPGTLNQLKFGYSPIRYGFSLWALGGLLLAQWLSDERWCGRTWIPEAFAVLAIIHSLVTLLYEQLEFASPALSRLDLVTWGGLFAFGVVVERLGHIAPRPVWYWPVLMLMVITIAGLVLWPAYEASFTARTHLYEYKWPGYVAFRRQVKEQGAERVNVIGYSSAWAVFSGEGLTTRVIHCPENVPAWIDCLDKNMVKLIAFAQGSQAGSTPVNESVVMQQYAGRFAMTFSDEHVHIYRVLP